MGISGSSCNLKDEEKESTDETKKTADADSDKESDSGSDPASGELFDLSQPTSATKSKVAECPIIADNQMTRSMFSVPRAGRPLSLGDLLQQLSQEKKVISFAEITFGHSQKEEQGPGKNGIDSLDDMLNVTDVVWGFYSSKKNNTNKKFSLSTVSKKRTALSDHKDFEPDEKKARSNKTSHKNRVYKSEKTSLPDDVNMPICLTNEEVKVLAKVIKRGQSTTE